MASETSAPFGNSVLQSRGRSSSPSVSSLRAFETWRLEIPGGPGAVRVSEFADLRPPGVLERGCSAHEAYGRPANKRDLGHRCHHCRKPFSSLGASLVAEPQQGPSQRFHPQCWQHHHTGAPKCFLGGDTSARSSKTPTPEGVSLHARASRGGTKSPVDVESRLKRAEPIITAYVDEWRRSSLDDRRTCQRASFARHGCLPPRPSPLDGLVSTEDSQGTKRVARGLSQRELEAVVGNWLCSPSAMACDECAVCFARPQRPMQLPCGHVFCADCVAPWLRRCALCPMCRQDLHPFLDTVTLQSDSVASSGLRGRGLVHRRALSFDVVRS